jgi:hypothetical protein
MSVAMLIFPASFPGPALVLLICCAEIARLRPQMSGKVLQVFDSQVANSCFNFDAQFVLTLNSQQLRSKYLTFAVCVCHTVLKRQSGLCTISKKMHCS